MSFEKVIYISYAHIDDESMIEGTNGWITEFQKVLKIRLSQLLERETIIWFDNKLQGNSFFASEIELELSKVKIMICIVTPRYVKSVWCNKEIDSFFKAPELSGGITVDNKAPIFKVIKTYVPLEEQSEQIRPLPGYNFFSTDTNSGRSKEFGSIDKNAEYWTVLNDVAFDIANFIEKLN